MEKIKETISKVLGETKFQKLKEFYSLITLSPSLIKNYWIDAFLYYKHSNVFKKNTLQKIEALIILRYHSLEKGLLHNPIRFKFGKETVKILIKLLEKEEIIKNRNRSQISAAYLVLSTYYELHKENNIDIHDYFPEIIANQFKNYATIKINSVKEHNINGYFENCEKDFYNFSNSRSSVRDYTGELINIEEIYKVINLAKNAPSVCNRQSVKVYYVENKQIINKILDIQGGLKGYDENISQLLIVVSDRSSFFSIGERNQLYIDGGIFLMNLLYALHFYKIAACPAHWGMNSDKDFELNKLLSLPDSEKVISLVSIGVPPNNFKTCLSLRRSSDEILKIIGNNI
ncbi:MAG: nitroreductase [Bacteroidetes bacterium HGW-Bacteroidetes-3]|jgi:nitroreductase|nr:MAG: nitroreductase [Bacteroidetes bacterium HGW-Bacteroidetes-3]